MGNKIVIPTGYMGSGSSAVTNFLSEIKGYDINNAEFEYVLLHCPDGLFDLEDKLLHGNNALRSDEAIHRFLNCMKDLYDKPNYWVSGYKTKVSNDFVIYCEKFINSLLDAEIADIYWYYQQNPIDFKMQVKNYWRKVIGKLTHGKIKIDRPVQYQGMKLAFPTQAQYYKAAQDFLNEFYVALGYKEHNLVLDQFILPHNLNRISHYFDENSRFFVVDRDPRDVFILNKYVWAPQSVLIPYPLNVEDFCKIYKKVRGAEKKIEDNRIMHLHFEDLIYKYEESEKSILNFLNVLDRDHYKKKQIFNPDISINNTQLFKNFEESKYIAQELKEFLYDFPKGSRRETQETKIF